MSRFTNLDRFKRRCSRPECNLQTHAPYQACSKYPNDCYLKATLMIPKKWWFRVE